MPVPASFQDTELMRKVALGDRAAFGQLFDRYPLLSKINWDREGLC